MTGAMITGRDGVMDDGRSTNETDFLLHCRQVKGAPQRAMAWPESADTRLVDQISAMKLACRERVWVAGLFRIPSRMGNLATTWVTQRQAPRTTVQYCTARDDDD